MPIFSLQQNLRRAQRSLFAACLALSASLSSSLSLASPPPPPDQPTIFKSEGYADMHQTVHFRLSLSAKGQTVYNNIRVNSRDSLPEVVINLPATYPVTATLDIIETSTGRKLGSETRTRELPRENNLELRVNYESPKGYGRQAVITVLNREHNGKGRGMIFWGHSH